MGFCPPCQIKQWAFVQWDIVQWAFVLVGFCPSGLLSVPRLSGGDLNGFQDIKPFMKWRGGACPGGHPGQCYASYHKE